MTCNVQPVILSGGSGTRLWPASRGQYPKQFQTLAGERTLLQETVLRLGEQDHARPPIVICNEEQRFFVADQLQSLGVQPKAIVLEPVGRNTAPAAAVAALLTKDEPDTVLLIMPADHMITDLAGFRQAVTAGSEIAGAGLLMTFGVRPTSPHTGYGYIRGGEPVSGDTPARMIAEFREKPDAATATAYLASGDYFWNSGLFVFRAKDYLDELTRIQPAIVAACQQALDQANQDLDFLRLAGGAFQNSPSISIDYAVMEHTARGAVLPVSFGWSDIGSWQALWQIGHQDQDGNVLQGDVVARQVTRSLVRSENRLITVQGLDDILIVETADSVLVTKLSQSEAVKDLVEDLKRRDRPEAVSHPRYYRPWGYFDTLTVGPRYQVKRLMVKPGRRLSLQLHHHRAEHWIVVSGTAKVTQGDQVRLLAPNESVYLPLGTRHRLENPGLVPLILIEVQSGDYLGEDDIVRLQDDYHRLPEG